MGHPACTAIYIVEWGLTMSNQILRLQPQSIPPEHKNDHPDYEYYKRVLIPKGQAEQCAVSLYEIPPGKSAYPYHYHTKNEEVFYILSGHGVLKTLGGDQIVSAGDFLYFPANEDGAHKLTNASETDPLVYLDFDTYNGIDVAVYPDSGKIGIWGKDINQVYKTDQQVDYYTND